MTYPVTPLLTVHPGIAMDDGPIIKVWTSGGEFVSIPTSPGQALYIANQIISAVMARLPKGPV